MKTRIFLFLLPLFLSLPFLHRAYFVDDSYFVEIAHWLSNHPSQPYDFRTDDAGLQNLGWEKNGFVRMVNPLGHQYYLALLMKIFGDRVTFLRLGCVLLQCFTSLFLFGLARRFTDHPLLATVLVLVTPVMWLTSHSLLIDSTMGFFFFGGLYFFIRMCETGRADAAIGSGVFMGAAILCKYPAVFVLPLSGAWLLLRWKKTSRRILAVLPWTLALLALGGYSAWTKSLYGEAHIWAASARMVHVFGWAKVISFLVFLSGSLCLPLISWLIAKRRTVLGSAFIASLFLLLFSGPVGGFTKMQSALLGLWITTSLLTVTLSLQRRSDWVFPRDHFIFIWVAGFIVMMLLVMDWVAVRYYVIVAPAFIFMVVRLVEKAWPRSAERVLKLSVLVTCIFTSALAYADYQQAEPSRQIGEKLKAAGYAGGPRHYYLGDSFTVSYLRGDGWIPCFPQTELQAGDYVLAKEVTMPLAWFYRKSLQLRLIDEFNFPSTIPLKVMDYTGSAGFYASVWGALPFTFSTGPWERFRLFEVINVEHHEPS